jgi:hypothetical protein
LVELPKALQPNPESCQYRATLETAMVSVMGKQTDKPTVPVLYLRLTAEHEAALQAFIGRQRVKPDRTAVGLTALEEFLRKEGDWPAPKPATRR